MIECNRYNIKFCEATNTVTISKKCTVTNHLYSLRLDANKYFEWEHGSLIQNVFPTLSADHREFIMTGTTPKEWEKMFGLE